jgi:1,4-dihydroxy-6-naphthoate synthase
MNLTIGLSPCPNDTFIFDALLQNKVDTEGLTFSPRLEDVETLNTLAGSGQLDITKVSYGAVPRLIYHYRILDAGGALGEGVGPLLVAKNLRSANVLDPATHVIALPGRNTTAHLLFSMAFPHMLQKKFMPFHEIEKAVLEGVADAGVIIHENRFTYAAKGLHLLAELGDLWESQTGLPIPLGGILARRSYPEPLLQKINRVIRRSLEYAWQHYPELAPFVKDNAQEMDEEVMKKHINLYVNNYSLGLGSAGRAAVWKLLEASSIIQPTPGFESFEVFVD